MAALAGCADDDPDPAPEGSLPRLPVEVIEGRQPTVEDYEIMGAVRKELWGDEKVGRRPLGVAVHERIVTLTGTVNDAAAKRLAVQGAERVPGVRGVIDHIHIESRSYAERGQGSAAPPSDAEIERAIQDVWRQDERLAGATLRVRVREGVAFLKGRVDTPAARHAAEADARHVIGVARVRNGIAVTSGATKRHETGK